LDKLGHDKDMEFHVFPLAIVLSFRYDTESIEFRVTGRVLARLSVRQPIQSRLYTAEDTV